MTKNYNFDTEQMILGSLLNNNSNFHHMAEVLPEDFYHPLHQEIFRRFSELHATGAEISPPLLTPYLEGNKELSLLKTSAAAYLIQLSSLGYTINIVGFVDLLKKFSRCRRVEKFLEKNSRVDLDTNLDEWMGELETSLFNPAQNIHIRREHEVVSDIIKELQEDLPCYSTGYKNLDFLFGGGLYRKRNYCIVAPEKGGKTAMLGSISHNLSKQKVRHMYLAVEMGAGEIHKRILAYQMGVNPMKFYDPQVRQSDDFQLNVGRIANNREGTTFYVDAPGITFDNLRRLILSSVRKYRLEGIIIDYLQIINPSSRYSNTSDYLKELSQWIAEIGRQLDIFTLSASQQNEAGDAKGSKGIQAAMDLMFYLHMVGDPGKPERFGEVRYSRHTRALRLGDIARPSFRIGGGGVFLEEISIEKNPFDQQSFLEPDYIIKQSKKGEEDE